MSKEEDPRGLRVLFPEDAIRRRVAELARQISADYAGKGDVLLVGVLKGAFIFLADLCRAMTVPRRVDFIAVSSYGDRTVSSGTVRLVLDLRGDIRGRHVLVVEDIVDTGTTLHYLLDLLRLRGPASVKTCAFLRKEKGGPPVDYVGFEIEDEWVVGYGLDYAEAYRTLPYIAVLQVNG
ncbi:MAG TPA: hypoxanthine phosphoribosyltransferase [Planctomycetota bacterium]|nr:hypoxanthine phosphoribosyltransferase [Planctomycetota bacterium]